MGRRVLLLLRRQTETSPRIPTSGSPKRDGEEDSRDVSKEDFAGRIRSGKNLEGVRGHILLSCYAKLSALTATLPCHPRSGGRRQQAVLDGDANQAAQDAAPDPAT